MSKKQNLQITAVKQGTTAQIRIIGVIGWDVDSETFRAQIDSLTKEGATSAHIYLNTPGGSCFDAAEIVNILSVFKGNITGEGGAIVASAGTYIAANCKTFVMPENGMFMVHKPSGGISGTLKDIEAYAKLLKDIETEYYDTYKSILKDTTLFDDKWNAGDWWMTAKEAKEQGFITGIKPKVKIDRETAAMIMACGSPIEIQSDYQPTKTTEMDVKTTALMLGLPETATEVEVKAKLEANKQAAADLETMRAAQAKKEKDEKDEKIVSALDKAIADKRIKADARAAWKKILEDDFTNGSKALEAIAPIEKPSAQIAPSVEGKGKTYKGKTFEQLQDEDPDTLAELEDSNPDAFSELFSDYKKRNSRK